MSAALWVGGWPIGDDGGVLVSGLGPAPTPPTLPSTPTAGSITATGATLSGTVTSNGAATTVSFEYGLTTAYGSIIAALQSPLAPGAVAAAVSAIISGLIANTLYHWRIVATNSAGSTNSADQTFTTSAAATPYVFVNSVHGFSSTGISTMALPALSLTAGNHIFIHARWEDANTVTGVTDTAGNIYTPLTRLSNSNGPTVSQWFFKLNAAGNASNVVTVTWNNPTSFRWVTSLQFSGSPIFFDNEDINGLTGLPAATTVTSGSVITAAEGILLAGRSVYNSQTSSAFNQSLIWVNPITDTSSNFGSVGYRITTGPLGPLTITETGSATSNRAMSLAYFSRTATVVPYAFVSSTDAYTTASGNTLSAPAINTPAGIAIFVWIYHSNSSANTTITDTAGNVYMPLTRIGALGPTTGQWHYRINALPHAANIITMTLSGGLPIAAAGGIMVMQFSGAPSMFDGETTAISAGTTSITSPSFNTAGAGLILAGRNCIIDQTSFSFGAGFTPVGPIAAGNNKRCVFAYRVTSGALTAQTVTETGNAASNRALGIACFKQIP